MTAQSTLIGDEITLPTAGPRSNAKEVRGLIALTNDPVLIKALRDLATAGTTVNIVSDLRSMMDELLQHTSSTALIDATALEGPVVSTVDAITEQLPDLCLMVAGLGADQQLLSSRIADQSVFRFVHKPASPQRLKLFLEAAARPASPKGNNAIAPATAGAKEPLARIETAVRGKSPKLLASIGGAAIAAIVAAAWALWPDGKSATPVPESVVIPSTPASARPEAAALIAQANTAFNAARYIASDGTSAAELYQAALKLDPPNQAARNGYDRALDQGMRRAEEALLAGKWKDASIVAEAARLIAPKNSRLDFLNAQISREQARINADTSQRQTVEAHQTQIRTALATMNDRLQHGAQIDPAAKSAVASFREAEAISVNDPAVRSARDKLIAALLTAADAELVARRPPAAKRLMEAAGSLNSNAPGLDVLRRRVDEVTAQLTAPEAPKPAPRAEPVAPAAQPAQESVAIATPSAPPAKPVNEVISASKLRLLRSSNPVYPERALQALTSGWVELEFTVTQDGSVKDIVVISAEPKTTFNASAIAALGRYRYAPVVRDGVAVPQRARLKMRFTVEDPN